MGLGWNALGASTSASSGKARPATCTSTSTRRALTATSPSPPLAKRVDDAGERFPVYAFEGVPARLRGWSWKAASRCRPRTGRPAHLAPILSQLDAVRGERRDTGEPPPCLAPLRAMLGLEAQWGAWAGRLELRGTARQTRVPVLDTATPGSGIWRLALTRQWRADRFDVLGYLKLDNLGNQLATNATATATIRGLAPQPGRSLAVGAQLRF